MTGKKLYALIQPNPNVEYFKFDNDLVHMAIYAISLDGEKKWELLIGQSIAGIFDEYDEAVQYFKKRIEVFMDGILSVSVLT